MGLNLAGKGDGAGWERPAFPVATPLPPPRNRERLGRAADPQNNRVQLPGPPSGRRGALLSQAALPGEPGGWMSGDLAHPTFSEEVPRGPSSESPNGRRWRPHRWGTPTYPPSPRYRRQMPLLALPAPPTFGLSGSAAAGLPRGRRAPTRRTPWARCVPGTEDLRRPRGQGQSLAGTRDPNVPSAACPEIANLASRGFRW